MQDETITSLTYAARVKLITNNANKNQDSEEVARLKAIIRKLKAGEDASTIEEGASSSSSSSSSSSASARATPSDESGDSEGGGTGGGGGGGGGGEEDSGA